MVCWWGSSVTANNQAGRAPSHGANLPYSIAALLPAATIDMACSVPLRERVRLAYRGEWREPHCGVADEGRVSRRAVVAIARRQVATRNAIARRTSLNAHPRPSV